MQGEYAQKFDRLTEYYDEIEQYLKAINEKVLCLQVVTTKVEKDKEALVRKEEELEHKMINLDKGIGKMNRQLQTLYNDVRK